MQIPYNIEQFKFLRKRRKFTFDDITNVLFYNKPPIVTTYPFNKVTQNQALHNLPITFKIITDIGDLQSVKQLSNIITAVGGTSVKAPTILLELSPWLYSKIVSAYKIESDDWLYYFITNLHTYCKTVELSNINWSCTKIGLGKFHKENSLSFEQSLWIKLNTDLDKVDHFDQLNEIKESLLPWINYNLYKASKKAEEDVRINSRYEEQRRSMEDGTFKDQADLDSIIVR